MRSSGRRLIGAGGLGVVVLIAACDAVLGPSLVDGNWHVIDRGRFTFYVRPESFAERSLDAIGPVLEDQYDTSVGRLGLAYAGRISVFLFNSGADAGLDSDLGQGDHSGVAYASTSSVRVACVPPLDANLYALVAHEVNHVITQNGLGRPGTTFVNEGLASAVISERYHALGPTHYYAWAAARRGQLPPIASLADDERWQSYPQQVAYSVSASFLAYLIETYGATPFRSVYYASSREFAATFAAAYGRSLEEAEREWIEFVVGRAGG
jgi:hypothetical protein